MSPGSVLHYLIPLCLLNGSEAYLPQSQIDALSELYNATNGDRWTSNCTWNISIFKKPYIYSPLKVPPCLNLICGICIGYMRSDAHSANEKLYDVPEQDAIIQTVTAIYMDDFNLDGTIPGSIFSDLLNLTVFDIVDEPLLRGTIPSEICQRSLVNLWLINTSLSGSIPSCLNTSKYYDFSIKQNLNLKGMVPAIHSPDLWYLYLNNNGFVGRISTILPDDEYPMLSDAVFHSNKFHDDDIGPLIKKLFLNSPRLFALTLFDNEYVCPFP